MANLKEIRDRINSVKNTRKITEAMRLVAAAKVRRAQEQVLRSRPFADRLARILENLQSLPHFVLLRVFALGVLAVEAFVDVDQVDIDCWIEDNA